MKVSFTFCITGLGFFGSFPAVLLVYGAWFIDQDMSNKALG